MFTNPTAWAVWALASFFYAYQYILRVAPGVLLPDIVTKFGMTADLTGQFSGVYYLFYALAHIPLGILLDRFGPKYILPIFMALTVVGMAPLVFTDFWIYPLIGRALVGIGSSAAILGVFKVIRIGFSPERFTWMLSLGVTIGLVGAIFGGGPLNLLYQRMGMEDLVIVLMIAGAALSVLTFIALPHTPPESTETNVFRNVVAVLKNKTVLAICLLAGLMVGPLDGFADAWGITFLRNVYGLDDASAAHLSSFVFIGMCFGGPILSLVARHTLNDIAVIFLSALVMFAAFVGLLMAWFPAPLLFFVFFAVGVACAYQIIAIAHASTLVPQSQMGLTSALANMIIMTFGYLFHAAIGSTVAYFNKGAVAVDAYASEALVMGLAVIPAALIIAAIGFFWLSGRSAISRVARPSAE